MPQDPPQWRSAAHCSVLLAAANGRIPAPDQRSLPVTEPSAEPSTEDPTILATRRWLEQAVIGLNLCPFARAPYIKQRVRFRVSLATDEDQLVADLAEELGLLAAAEPDAIETTLLIHPHVLQDFYDFNDFLEIADATLQALGLEGELQVASFHPDYQFADSAPDAIENCTNRSPFPTLHLLRESSIDRAIEVIEDTDEIYRRNIETLRGLGWEGWKKLMQAGAGA